MQTQSLKMLDRNPSVTARTLSAWNGAWVPAPAAVDVDPGELRILIVNEDMRSADTLKCMLRDLGYRATYTAYSAQRALMLADSFSPTLALLDLELPDMSGFQLAQKFRAHRHSHVRNMCLLAVAECVLEGECDRASAAGFTGYLTKPVPRLQLDQLMRALGR
jgi:CheY-like chemotaxis protein